MAHDPLQSVGLGHENEAIRGCSRRAADLRDALGTYHPDYATALNQLSLLLIMQGEADSAEPFLREALEVRRIALGESHPDYATNLSSLGGILWARGELDEAEPILRKVFEIRSTTLGHDHPKSITSRNSLEQLIQARKTWEEECLSRMQRARLGSANETAVAAAPAVVEAERSGPPAGVSSAPSLAPEVNPPSSTAFASANHASPEELSSKTVAIPSPLADSIAAMVASHLDSSIREIPGPTPPTLPQPAAPPVGNSSTRPPTSVPREIPPEPVNPKPIQSRGEPNEETPSRDLSALIESLEVSNQSLSRRLTQAARDIITAGRCPSEDFFEACQESQSRFREADLLIQSEWKRHDPRSALQSSADLEALKQRVEGLNAKKEVRNQQRRRRGVALEILREIEGLKCPSDSHFEPLNHCRWEAEALSKAVQLGQNLGPTLSGIVDALADGGHPYHAVLRLIQADDSTLDHDWSIAYETIATSFGPLLAVAIGRGRIVLKSSH